VFSGADKEEIETPALLIDLDIMEKNIRTMGDYYRSKKGAALRPHQKGHRLPIIARKQIEAGATGVSMTSLGLADFYVNSGIDDILITSEIYGKNKIAKLCALSKLSNVTVGVDNIANVRQLSEAALANGTKINIAPEVYLGKARCGVQMAEMKSFVKQLVKMRGVTFKGLWWHHKLSDATVNDFELRRKETFQTLDKIARLRGEIEDSGISVEMLSGGQTCTWNITPEYPNLGNVQVQAGNYVFNDWCSALVRGSEAFECALTVLTRCISRPTPDEAMFDFGMNSCAYESGEDYRRVVGPKFKDVEGIEEVYEREEISFAMVKAPSREVKVGGLFEVVPPHADTTAKLYDRYYGMRNGKVEVIWPNHGRGLF
jgi:3-hydroxy-D-aspartate aldolase